MRFLFNQFPLSLPLLKMCKGGHVLKQTERCNNTLLYDLEPAETWEPPQPGEGPTFFGMNNPGCSDCSECATRALLMDVNTSAAICPLFGGYFAIEFARDVALQSTLYRTTQENILHFVQQHYDRKNTVCIVSSGQHDVSIPNFTPEQHARNVVWYVQLLYRDVCHDVVWIGNTAPAREHTEWPQGREILRRMDQAVVGQTMLSAFVDVFGASMHFGHMDNIHMEEAWYEALAQVIHDALL